MRGLEQRASIGGNLGAGDSIEAECDAARIGAGLQIEIEFEFATVTMVSEIDSGIDGVIFDALIKSVRRDTIWRDCYRGNSSPLRVADPSLPCGRQRTRLPDSS